MFEQDFASALDENESGRSRQGQKVGMQSGCSCGDRRLAERSDALQLTFSGSRTIAIGIDAAIFPPKYFVLASNNFSMSTPVSGCCRPSRCVTSAICAKCSTVSIFI